jgi:hypothetical protein
MSHFLGHWRTFFLQATDAPAVYGEAAGLMALSTLALGNRWVDSGDGIAPNLYILLTGDSSVARKSTAIRFARKAVEEINADLVGPKDYTMEGLYKWMQVKNASTGKGRNKLGLFAEEWGADLARSEAYGGTMREDMCGLYDGDDFSKVRAKSDSITILRPRVNLFGGVAYSLLGQYCSRRDWDTGFFMRFLFVTPIVMREKTVFQPKRPQAQWQYAVQQLGMLYDAMKANQYGLSLSPAAMQYFGAFLQALQIPTDNGVAAIYVERLRSNILKLALLYQIDRDPHTDISLDAMEDACNFVMYCLWPSQQKVYEVTTQREFETALNKVVALARRPQGVGRQEVYRTFASERGLPQALLNFVKRSAAFQHGLDSNGIEKWDLIAW